MTFNSSEFYTVSPATPVPLAAGDSVKVFVSYKGADFGRDNDTLKVVNDNPAKNSSPLRLPVSGFALWRVYYRLANTTIDTHTVRPNQTGLSVTNPDVGTFYLRNISGGPAAIDSIKFAVGAHFFHELPTPYTQNSGTAYDSCCSSASNPRLSRVL